MTVRSILSAHKAVLLGGVLLTTMLPAPFAMAQDANLPVKAAPAANDSIWYSHGVFDAGGNIFIEKPPVASAGSQLTRSGSHQRRLTAMPRWTNTARCRAVCSSTCSG